MVKCRCTYCQRPAYTGGRKPLCEPHFELWLIISHLRVNALPATVPQIQAEMIARTAMGHGYGFDLSQVEELLAQMSAEVAA